MVGGTHRGFQEMPTGGGEGPAVARRFVSVARPVYQRRARRGLLPTGRTVPARIDLCRVKEVEGPALRDAERRQGPTVLCPAACVRSEVDVSRLRRTRRGVSMGQRRVDPDLSGV